MGKKAKRKRSIKSAKQDDISLSTDVSTNVKVQKNASKSAVKEEGQAEVAGAADNKNHEGKQSVTKRKRATSADDSGPVDFQVPPRKRRPGVKSRQNDEPLQQAKDTRQSVNKRQHLVKKQHVTRKRKSSSGAEKKKPDEQQLEAAVVSDVKKNTKVKCELESPPVASPDKAVDKKADDIEKPNVPCTSLKSCKKFIGAHVSISGMFATYFFGTIVLHFYTV